MSYVTFFEFLNTFKELTDRPKPVVLLLSFSLTGQKANDEMHKLKASVMHCMHAIQWSTSWASAFKLSINCLVRHSMSHRLYD